MPILRLPARPILFLPRLRLHHPGPQLAPLHTTPPTSAQTPNDASKKSNLLDKDAINTSSNEYSKSGGGDAEIAHWDAAFDPRETGPEATKRGVEAEQGGPDNSAEVSPANKDVSDPGASSKASRVEGSPARDVGQRKSSGGGDVAKGGGGKR